jgi:hypothetical protein
MREVQFHPFESRCQSPLRSDDEIVLDALDVRNAHGGWSL